MTKVYDFDGTERSLSWLAQNYDGCSVAPTNTDNASEVWRLAAIYVTEGPAIMKVEARRGDSPVHNQPVVITWPELAHPSEDLPLLPASANNWSARGVIERTNLDGFFGAGLGSAFGPFYHAWILSSAPSDCLLAAGMKGGTNHRGPLHGVWMLQPVEPAHDSLTDALLWSAERAQVIQFNPQAALQRRIFADGFVPNSPEVEIQYETAVYVAQRAEHMGTGEVRIYYARLGDWGNVSYVSRAA